MKRAKERKISVLNWMGTILLSCIPGVNIIAFILMIILAGTASKRNYAIACLLLCIIVTALSAAAMLVFPEAIHNLANTLRNAHA